MRKTTFILLFTFISLFITLFGATVDCDFATIDYPEQWDFEVAPKGFDVKVTPKASAAGQDLSVHLHWMKVNGYGGFAKYQMPKKGVEAGKAYTFHFLPKLNDNIHRFDACVFLAPGGDFKKKTKEHHVTIKLPPPKPYAERPTTVTYKKSYIWIDENPAPVSAGDEFTLKVHYYLDPSDTWGDKKTKLIVRSLGPWIDNPDGVINKKRQHVFYGAGMGEKTLEIDPGEGVFEVPLKLGTSFRYNGCSFLCKFKQPDGKEWPWEYRGGSLTIIPKNDSFRLVPTARGGCFYYEETPKIALNWSGKATGGIRMGKLVVKDCLGRVQLERTIELDPARQVQMIELPELKARGVFSLEVDGSEYCYFARIPKFKREAGRLTPFGVSNIEDLGLSRLAYDLGFSLCRHFISWNYLEPAKGRYLFHSLDAKINNNTSAGLKPWIQLYAPPAWALPEGLSRPGQFEPSPFDLKEWERTLLTLAKRYQGKLYGFEFLNEIVPGNSCKDPVKTYVDICRTGYTALKAYDPKLVCQLAGGLWPHGYRIDCLNAGIAKYVDILPIHYSNYDGVKEAMNDLAVRGIKNVRVADNETARGYSVWNYPPALAFEKSIDQCRWVMTRWPDELAAGADFICYFGGNADPCGNWSYMLDATSPRPVVATLAVVQGKLAYTKPVGKFYLGETICHLFERDGKGILFVTGAEMKHHSAKETKRTSAFPVMKLPTKGALIVTDFQGNEWKTGKDGIQTSEMPVIVEGFDLEAIKLQAALQVGAALAPSALPQHVVNQAKKMTLPLSVMNPYAEKTTFTVSSSQPAWGTVRPISITLDPGETRTVELEFKTGAGTIAAVNQLVCEIAAKGFKATKNYVLYMTDESALGNLIKESGFEDPLKRWTGQGTQVVAPIPGNAENKALRLSGKGKGKYVHECQVVRPPVPGGTYLYSCWARGEGMGGGSNVDESDAEGTRLANHFALRVFSIGGTGSKGWRYLSKKMTYQPKTAKVALVPVADGAEGAYTLFDNMQLSLYKGSDFVAFAGKDATKSSPIPLLCDNLIRAEKGYNWDEKNLAGVARFSWSEKGLVFEATVEDDKMAVRPVITESGEETLKGDAIALCIFPRLGADGHPENDQLRWYISNVNPGGGSGKTTVYRPQKYSLGAKSGQLCKDSSVYQIDIRREGTLTTYRFVIPWAEIPSFSPAKGASFGCNLVLVDSDGGDALGKMVWGGGLKDDSADCGLVTLTD